MAVRPIDAEKYMELLKEQYLHHKSMGNSQAAKVWQGAMQLLHDMPTLTPPNEWVSVEERLPEGNGEYIVTACDEGCPAGEGIWYDTVAVFAEYYDGCWTWNDGTEYDLTDIVTHWMPLPAPPDRRPPEGDADA